MPIIQLIRNIRIINKYQILTNCDEFNIPLNIKIFGYLLTLFFSPISLFFKKKENFALRITNCFKELGPIYIKFGQTLSTRTDLIGNNIANQLKHLQDKLKAFKVDIAHQIIFDSFNTTHHELFAAFDDVPIAAASISQVHKAKLKTGEDVAVKILRPNIHKIYARDIKLLKFIAKIISKIFNRTKRLKLKEVINIFHSTMLVELDLRLEAAAISEMQENYLNNTDIHIPKVYWSINSKQILVTEWINGISIYDKQKLLEQKIDISEISKKMAIMFFNQAYRDGFFHADLHPGNILVQDNGIIALLDFGIMGRLSNTDRFAIAEILLSFLNRDYKSVAQIHSKVGYIPQDTNLELFAQNCRAIAEPIIGLPIKDISIGKLLTQLFQITENFGMETQPQLLLLQKSMVIIEGIGQTLDPEMNMWQLAEPWIKKWADKNLTPEAKVLRTLKKFISSKL